MTFQLPLIQTESLAEGGSMVAEGQGPLLSDFRSSPVKGHLGSELQLQFKYSQVELLECIMRPAHPPFDGPETVCLSWGPIL